MSSEDEMSENGDEYYTQTTRSSNVKVIEHVLPRIDAEKYQADIPPMLSKEERKMAKEGIFCYFSINLIRDILF